MQILFTLMRGGLFTVMLACCTLIFTVDAAAEDVSAAAQDSHAIHALLDDFHAAAAEADRDRYLGHFAPDAVFMGTDDWERWPLPEFTDYVDKRFGSGGGWVYASEERHVNFAASGNTAWFDEIVVSPRWGRFRGTGVLLRLEEGWKLAHYSLTMLMPNERFEDAAAIAGEGFSTRKASSAEE